MTAGDFIADEQDSAPTPHKVVMGFDFGTSRIGVAVGQELTRTATPLTTVAAKDGKPDWRGRSFDS